MDFVALVDLVKTVTKNKVKNIEVLGNPSEESNLTESLYEAISKGKIKTDDIIGTLLIILVHGYGQFLQFLISTGSH